MLEKETSTNNDNMQNNIKETSFCEKIKDFSIISKIILFMLIIILLISIILFVYYIIKQKSNTIKPGTINTETKKETNKNLNSFNFNQLNNLITESLKNLIFFDDNKTSNEYFEKLKEQFPKIKLEVETDDKTKNNANDVFETIKTKISTMKTKISTMNNTKNFFLIEFKLNENIKNELNKINLTQMDFIINKNDQQTNNTDKKKKIMIIKQIIMNNTIAYINFNKDTEKKYKIFYNEFVELTKLLNKYSTELKNENDEIIRWKFSDNINNKMKLYIYNGIGSKISNDSIEDNNSIELYINNSELNILDIQTKLDL